MRLRATIRIRNDEMIEARKRLNLSQVGLAAFANVPLSLVCRLERLNYPRIFKEEVLLLANALDLTPEQIFPKEMVGWGENTIFSFTKEVPTDKLLEYKERNNEHYFLPAPDIVAEKNEKFEKIFSLIDKLESEREKQVMKMLYGLGKSGKYHTTKDISKIIGLTRETVNHHHRNAIRKLQKMAGSFYFMNDEDEI